MKKSNTILQEILENNSTFFFRSKKAIFLFLMVTVVSSIWPSYPDGSIVDLIWSKFYIIGPTVILSLIIMMTLITIKNRRD